MEAVLFEGPKMKSTSLKTIPINFHLGTALPMAWLIALLAGPVSGVFAAEDVGLSIKNAEYDSERHRLKVEVSLGKKGQATIQLYNDETGALLGEKSTRGKDVRFRIGGLAGNSVPCTVRAYSGGQSDSRYVEGAPSHCDDKPPPPPPPGNEPPSCGIVAPVGETSIEVGDSVRFEAIGDDPEGFTLSWEWNFNGGTDSTIPNQPVPGNVTFDHDGSFNVVLTVTDSEGATCTDNVIVVVGSPPTDLPPKVAEEPSPGTSGSGDGNNVVLAFNDLGMHCADLGSYPFSILPLFNVLNAQVIRRGSEPELLDHNDGIELYYSAASNPNDPVGPGSINSTSRNYPVGSPAGSATVRKSDFWDTYNGSSIVSWLLGLDPPPDEGLFGAQMPGIGDPYYRNDPRPFTFYDEEFGWFSAFGIPITAVDDQGRMNSYPLMRVQAVETGTGSVLATTDAVVPVSTEVDCRDCHALGKIGADPVVWPELDFVAPASADRVDVEAAAKHNILVLHDEKHPTNFIVAGEPVLCATCHRSNALAGVGGPQGNPAVPNMSSAMHGFHGRLQVDGSAELLRVGQYPELIDPADMGGSAIQLIPDDGSMEETCFSCHPGKITQCFRGAMYTAGQKCQDCHGGMLATGGEFDLGTTGQPREPWMDEPKCSSCHTGHGNDPVGTLAFDQNDPAATPIEFPGSRFAENPDTLYRNSRGHQGVACEGCHGSPHAIWPNRDPFANDNVPAIQLQGHAGTLRDCTVCHGQNAFPGGTLGGPHGMHPVNDPNWIKGREDGYHEDYVWQDGKDQCAACHGADHRGTRLSRVPVDRVMKDAEGNVRAVLAAGENVSCDLCHSLEKSFED